MSPTTSVRRSDCSTPACSVTSRAVRVTSGRCGTTSRLSHAGSYARVCSSPAARLWFQLYWSRDRGFTAELLAAVVEAGFEAVVLTVDVPAVGRRERDLRAAFALPDDLALPNIPRSLERRDFHAALSKIVDATLTWRDLEWLREQSPLPLLLKGIL